MIFFRTAVKEFVLFLISYYFTSIISENTLSTYLQYVFVFIYFFMLCNLIYIFVKKKNMIKLNYHLIPFTLIILLFAICVGPNISYHKTSFSVVDSRNSDYKETNRIWISDIFVDGNSINLQDFSLPYGWSYYPEWNDIISDIGPHDVLSLPLPRAQNIKIRFVYYNDFLKTTSFIDGNREVNSPTLQRDGDDGYIYDIESVSYKPDKIVIISKYITLAIFIYVILFLFSKTPLNKKRDNTIFKTKDNIIIGVTGTIISFQFLGYRLFLKTGIITINLINLIIFTLSCIIISFILFKLLNFFLTKKEQQFNSNPADFKFHSQLFILITCIWLFALFIFYPGNITSDITDQYKQAIGINTLSDWHPFLMTFIMSLLLKLYDSIFFLEIVQILYMSYCYSWVFYELYKKGINKSITVVLLFAFSVWPGNFMAATGLSKDAIYTATLVWSCVLFYKISISKKDFFVGKGNIIALTISMILLYTMRHNGFIPYIFMIIYLIFISVHYFKKIHFNALIPVVVSLIAIAFIYGPLFNILQVQKNDLSPYIPMFTADGSCINKNKSLNENSEKILTNIMPLEAWGKNYNRFSSDSYLFATDYPMDLTNISGKEAFQVYLDALFKYPDLVLLDRLDGMNILWNIYQPEESLVNSKWHFGIYNDETIGLKRLGLKTESSSSWFYIDTFWSNFLIKVCSFLSNNKLLDAFFWRSGIYFSFLFVALVYSLKKKKQYINIMLIPFWGNTISWVFALSYQAYRYIYYVQLVVIIHFLFLIISPSRIIEKENMS